MSVQAIGWVLDHSQAELGARLVAISVANHADKNGSNAWAAVATYADEAHLSERQTRYALRKLEASGELRCTGQHGYRSDRMTNVYEFPGMLDGGQILHPVASNGGQSTTVRGAILDTNGGHSIAPKPSLEPSTNRPKNKNTPVIVSYFDEFYEVYPRHEGRAAALKAWQKALPKADLPTILAGAIRYRDDPNREPGFTLHASTWLNQERWNDDPLPVRRHRRVSQANALLRQALEG